MNVAEERITHAAIDCFASFGIKKTTIEDIAERSRISKVTIYKYFSDKQTLCVTTGNSILSRYMKKLKDIAISQESVLSKLCLCVDIVSEFANSNLLSICKELATYHREIKIEFDAYQDIYRKTVYDLIDDGKKTMLIRMDIENEMLFHYIDMGVTYYQNNVDYRSRMIADRDYRDQFFQFILGAIAVDPDRMLLKDGD